MRTSTRGFDRRTLMAGAIGNVLEWYDFALYGYFAPVFAAMFFPSDQPSVSLLSAFGVFAIGFLARPLGALVFGYIGDTVGRREALTWSIILMAVPTVIVGLLPTYAAIGIAAPLALTLCRFLQGLSVGGEFTGSVTFLVEHAVPSQRGYIGSWAGFSAQVGALLGSGMGALVASNLTDEALHQWGWRLPFLLGSLIAFVGWYLRTRIPESPAFEQVRQARALSTAPIREVFTHQRIALAQVVGLVWVHGVGFYLLFVYLTTYLSSVTAVPLATVLMINTACMLLLAVLIPFMGRLSDTVGHKLLLLIGAAGLAITAYPSFIWLASGDLTLVWAAYVWLTVLMSCYLGPFFAVVVELFPTAQRYTGLSAGYNIAAALFGGTAPLTATLLIQWSGDILSPSLYLSLCALIALSVILTLRDPIPKGVSPQ